jgi:hypothetical protein
MEPSKHLRWHFAGAVIALGIAFFAAISATFAWYIYHTNAHTTSVRMAAGTSASLQISDAYDGTYGSSALLESFTGTLNPVSTNSIAGGFQKVYGFTNGSENQSNLVANLFGASDTSDYYQTSLFLRTNGSTLNVYLTDIGYEDSSAESPISTAIRVGFVVEDEEYIFAINTADNPEAEYNTATGEEGYVLDSSRTDGTTVRFTPYTSDNFCTIDTEAGTVTRGENAVSLGTLSGDGDGGYGDPLEVKIYIWLEGCDKDCTSNLCATTLQNLALSFAGLTE